ncbi:DUF2207 domain-containing protein [Patescibacteria group bacterium]|nr:DUF2207 domain-containing protein [Patescibacteria group bacterium]
MKNIWILILGLVLGAWLARPVLAFEPVNDCVIENFDSQIELKADSSAEITETLGVNCGVLQNKHGIFRILPNKAPDRAAGARPYTPIKLRSITDLNGTPYHYERSVNYPDNIITWKIGDPDRTISGINGYVIKYRISNVVIPSDNGNALYLNLNGSFWELPTNNFSATVKLPDGITQEDTNLKLYSGGFGELTNSLAIASWAQDGKSFTVTATEIPTRTGITIWAEFPTGLVSLYQPSWWFLYGRYLYWLAMLALIWFGWRTWKQYGQDPRFRGSIVVEYDPPKDLSPMEAGLLNAYGNLNPLFISATIIDLAVRGYLKIEEVKKEGWLGGKDWKLILLKADVSELKAFESKLLTDLFGDNLTIGTEKSLADQKNSFYLKLPGIRKLAYENIKSFFDSRGLVWQILFLVLGVLMFVSSVPLAIIFSSFSFGTTLGVSGIVWLIFGFLMSKRTQLGSETLYQLRGFQLYMRRAETYRMRFYEKENIFERYLPYAIVFGLTGIWAKAFAKMYQEKHSTIYVPAWYVVTAGSHFSIDNFASHLNSLSANMASTLASSPHSSGSGGGGFSGGGAGGGGGGSW